MIFDDILKSLQGGALRQMQDALKGIPDQLLKPPSLPREVLISPEARQMQQQWELYRLQKRDQFYSSLKSQLDQIAGQVALLDSEITIVEDALRAYRLPRTVYLNLLWLAYMAIVGVLVPLALLPIVGEFPLSLAYLLVSLFGLGLIGFLITLGIELVRLSRR